MMIKSMCLQPFLQKLLALWSVCLEMDAKIRKRPKVMCCFLVIKQQSGGGNTSR